MFDTIANMKFHLRTAFGDSKDCFGGDLMNPFQGVCQGNGGGPAVWLAVSLVLVDMLRAEGHTAMIAQALTGIAFALCGLIFVDDTDLFCTAENSATEAEFIVAQIQEAMLTWHDGLRCSGGALKPSKCSWGLIDFIWANGASPCAVCPNEVD